MAEFWYGVLGERCVEPTERYHAIRDGDVIRLRNMFLTEWTPKLPGQIWTPDGKRDLLRGQEQIESQRFPFRDEMYSVLDPYGKKLVLNAGRRTIRAVRGLSASNPDAYAYMGAVDVDHWNCDFGIPIIVSRPVADLFARYAEVGAPEIKELEGVVRIGVPELFGRVIPRAIGATLSAECEEVLRYRPALPRCYIHVVSPLSVKLAHNDSHPIVTAWTMYSTENAQFQDPYGYTYVELDPTERGAFEEAGDFIREYARRHGGRHLVTDFDGVVPRLEADIRIDKNPLRASKSAVRRLGQGVDRWVTETMRGLGIAAGFSPLTSRSTRTRRKQRAG